MVYSTIAFAILAAIGLIELSESILRPTISSLGRKKTRIYESRSEVKVIFVIVMIFLIVLPMFYPTNFNYSSQGYVLSSSGWFTAANTPVSVANGGTAFQTTSTDWFQAFQWMRQTVPGTTIAAWWDYGYWMAVMGNVTSLADNATINETQISLLGQALAGTPQDSLQVLKNDLHSPQYILIFIAGSYFTPSSSSTVYYMLTVPTPYPSPAGGDESKKQWFIRIGNVTCGCLREDTGSRALMYPDDFTPTPYFWANSTLGQLIPFQETSIFYNPVLAAEGQSTTTQSTYSATGNGTASGINQGYTELYNYVKPNTNTSYPFTLAFESSSLPGTSSSSLRLFSTVLIY
jgi:dolichyl-diphosphooligosaccharide--protein glycosyltransferase